MDTYYKKKTVKYDYTTQNKVNLAWHSGKCIVFDMYWEYIGRTDDKAKPVGPSSLQLFFK